MRSKSHVALFQPVFIKLLVGCLMTANIYILDLRAWTASGLVLGLLVLHSCIQFSSAR
jgi:hypothetical protein